MAVTEFKFEAGANGDEAKPENTGFTSLVTVGGTATISTAWAESGTRSLHLVGNASGALYAQASIPATNKLAVRDTIRIVTRPSADTSIIWLGLGSPTASRRAFVELTTDGKIRLRDINQAAKWNGTVTTSTGAIPDGVVARIECHVKQNTADAANGSFRLAAYEIGSTTPLPGMDSGIVTGVNLGADGIDQIRLAAKATSGAGTMDFYHDNFAYDPTAETFIGPPDVPPPTANVAAGGLYRLIDASGSAPTQGGTLTWAISPSVGVINAGGGKFLAPAPAAPTVYTVTATESPSGKSATATATATPAPTGSTDTVVAVFDGTNWVLT